MEDLHIAVAHHLAVLGHAAASILGGVELHKGHTRGAVVLAHNVHPATKQAGYQSPCSNG